MAVSSTSPFFAAVVTVKSPARGRSRAPTVDPIDARAKYGFAPAPEDGIRGQPLVHQLADDVRVRQCPQGLEPHEAHVPQVGGALIVREVRTQDIAGNRSPTPAEVVLNLDQPVSPEQSPDGSLLTLT